MKPRVLVLVGTALVLFAAIWFGTSGHRQAPPLSADPSSSKSSSAPSAPTGGPAAPSTAPDLLRPQATGTVLAPPLPAAVANRPSSPPPPASLPASVAGQPPPEAPNVPPPPTGNFAEAQAQLDKINLMLRDYRTLMGENPVGTNAEIMKAIMGGNLKGAKLGPPDGMSVNGSGELVDPWGTPYFFHQLSGTHMEVRSAGPDMKMWTGDDIVLK